MFGELCLEIKNYCYLFYLQDIQPENLQFYFPSFIDLVAEDLRDIQTASEAQKKINKKIFYVEKLMSKIAETGNRYELVGIHADGSLFPMEIAVREAKLSQKVFYIGTFRDITERKESEIKLKENEQRFRSLSRATFEGIIIHEPGKIVDTNIATAEMFRYELSELIGMNGLELIAPEYQDFVLEKMNSGHERPYEVVGVRNDGSTSPLEVEAKVFFISR